MTILIFLPKIHIQVWHPNPRRAFVFGSVKNILPPDGRRAPGDEAMVWRRAALAAAGRAPCPGDVLVLVTKQQ